MRCAALASTVLMITLRASCQNEFSVDAAYWMERMGPSIITKDDLLELPMDPVSSCLFVRNTARPWIYATSNDCKTFPKYYNIDPDIEKFQIKTTGIRVIRRGDLFKMTRLLSMVIEMNDKLEVIEDGVFINMTNMTFLSISNNNNLHVLNPDVFKGLDNLEQLILANTNILNIAPVAIATAYLPRLMVLDMSHNSLDKIHKYDLSPMNRTLLKTLKLSFCSINYIHPNALDVLVHLEHIELGQNYLSLDIVSNLLSNVIKSCSNFTDINLDELSIATKPTALLNIIAASNVTRLSLKKNRLQPLVPGFFPVMPNLRFLDLSDILATDVEAGTLNETIMPRLSTLILAKNSLNGISSGVLLPQLENLDVSYNSGDETRPISFEVQSKYFAAMRKIKYLNLSKNRLMWVYNSTFEGLDNLKVLRLHNSSIFKLYDNAFSSMKSLKVLDLSSNLFPIYGNLSSKTFSGLVSLEFLNLEDCSVTYIESNVFSATTKLAYLILTLNQIITLALDFLHYLPDLITLDISRNMLTPWNSRLFSNNKKLTTIYIYENQLSYITESMLADLTAISSVYLRNNPFTCDCHMKTSLKAVQNVSDLIRRYGLKCFAPKMWKKVAIEKFFIEDDSSCEVTQLFIFLTFLLMTTVLGLMIAVAYYYRSTVYYWWFVAKVKLRGKRNLEGQMNFQYDAFVSYSSEDRNFVVRLVAMLENYEPFLKLCVYERDFQIGDLISETVMESVAVSRRIILIVSDSFAQSQWCKWEMQIAQHHQMFLEVEGEMSDPLIMIKLGDVLTAHLTPTLRYIMKTRVFLEWDSEPIKQRLFWEKLRSTLLPAISQQDLDTY